MSAPASSPTQALSHADEVRAFVKSIHALDTSRRVGWAKLFAALERAEQLERDINIAREDLVLLSRFCGFSYGAMQELKMHDVYGEYLQGDTAHIASMFPIGAIHAGRDVGSRWKKMFDANCDAKKKLVEAKKDAATEHDKFFAAARKKERVALADEFGFPDVEAMLVWLSRAADK